MDLQIRQMNVALADHIELCLLTPLENLLQLQHASCLHPGFSFFPDSVMIGDKSTVKEERRSCTVLEVPTKRRLIPGDAMKGGGQGVSRLVELSLWLPTWQKQIWS